MRFFYPYKKFFNSTNWKFWIITAILIKSLFFILKLSEPTIHNSNYLDTFAIDSPDSASYLEPIEHLLSNGSYWDDFRMPGYGWLYFIFRLILSQTWALNAIVILQLILSAISVYVLALTSLKIFKKPIYFYTTFILFCLSTYVSLWDHFLLTESFCCSAFIFSTYFLFSNSKRKLFFSGIFLTWSIFLRPIMAPLMILFCCFILLKNVKFFQQIKSYNWKNLTIFLIGFILIDGAWILRNYKKYNNIYPLTKSIYYSGAEKSYIVPLNNFIISFGGSIVHWNPGAEITFFKPPSKYIKKKIIANLPEHIYTNEFNYDSLVNVKHLIREIESDKTLPSRKHNINLILTEKLNRYTSSIKAEKSILFSIRSRLKILKTYFIHSGTYNLFNKLSSELNMFEFSIKIFYSLLYLFVIISGFLGCLLLLQMGIKNIQYLTISASALYLALSYPVLLGLDEYRYFVPGYPLLLLTSIFTIIQCHSSFNKKIIKNA